MNFQLFSVPVPHHGRSFWKNRQILLEKSVAVRKTGGRAFLTSTINPSRTIARKEVFLKERGRRIKGVTVEKSCCGQWQWHSISSSPLKRAAPTWTTCSLRCTPARPGLHLNNVWDQHKYTTQPGSLSSLDCVSFSCQCPSAWTGRLANPVLLVFTQKKFSTHKSSYADLVYLLILHVKKVA